MQDVTGWKAVVGPIVGLAALLFVINAGVAQYQQGATELRAQSRATATAARIQLAALATPTPIATPVPTPTTVSADSTGDRLSELEGAADGVDDVGDESINAEVAVDEAVDETVATDHDGENNAAGTLAAIAASAQVLQIISQGGCAACHVIPSVPGAAGVIGPDLSTIGSEGGTRVPGLTAAAYIEESIRTPNAVIAPQCPLGPCIANIMPQDFGERLADSEIEALVEFLTMLVPGS